MQPLFGTGFLMAKYWYCYLRLYYIRKEQDSFRTEVYKGLMDYIHNKAANFVIGKMLSLPLSFTGSPHNICKNFGKPDLF